MLITVFRPCPEDESGYLKATIRVRNWPEMKALGWYRSGDDMEKAIAAALKQDGPVEAYVDDGDQGSGEPGSIQWHTVQLNQMDDKDAIQAYAKELGVEISKRGNVEHLRAKVLEALNASQGD